MRCFLLISYLLLTISVYAQTVPSALFGDSSPSFLKLEEAFVFDYEQTNDQLIVNWKIADGYYLYKKQFKVATKSVTLGEPQYPPSSEIEDEFFGLSEVFFGDITIIYPIIDALQDGSVSLRYQGCAEAGLCYTPSTQVIFLDAKNSNENRSSRLSDYSQTSSGWTFSSQLEFESGWALSLLVLFVLGIGLALTPCVYPMYPILSSIVMGKSSTNMSMSKVFSLAVTYVQGMAITYALVGLVVASVGVQFQAVLQNPILLSVFIVLFILLALVMFGVFEFQLPQSWQTKLSTLSNAQRAGQYWGVFIMGALSGLVASPCTTAPLTAVLLFIAQTENLWFGFIALYVLSIGMGIPLIAFAVTGGKFLPKAGAWMNVIKVSFGFMMLSVAIVFLERFWVSAFTNLLWGALIISATSYWLTVNQSSGLSFFKGLRTALFASGLVVGILVSIQALQTLKVIPPLLGQSSAAHSQTHPEFLVVKNLADFEQKLSSANQQGKGVMLDLYADWCVACKHFEKKTFPDSRVIKALENVVWMQIDLTANTPDNNAFTQAFEVKGLPTILFFSEQGEELTDARVTGFMDAQTFSQHIYKSL